MTNATESPCLYWTRVVVTLWRWESAHISQIWIGLESMKATHTEKKKSCCKIIEIFTTQQHSLLTCPSWSVHALLQYHVLFSCLLLLCFGIKGRCTWKMVGLRISTTEPNCWVACQGVWGSYPSHDRSIQLSYLQLLEWRKIYVAY